MAKIAQLQVAPPTPNVWEVFVSLLITVLVAKMLIVLTTTLVQMTHVWPEFVCTPTSQSLAMTAIGVTEMILV